MTVRASLVVRRLLIVTAFFGATTAAFIACGQDAGDRCQVTSDCADGLVCNQATQICTNANTSGAIDATTPDFIDSLPDRDAAPIDAPPDMAEEPKQ